MVRSWLGSIAVGLASMTLSVACASAEVGDDEVDEIEASEDPLASNEVVDYAAISPPELRVTTGTIDSRLGPTIVGGRRLAVIRRLSFQAKAARLVVDVDSYETSLVEAGALDASARAATASDAIADAPYLKSLAELSASGQALDSLDEDAPTGDVDEPFALTVDMCQSRKPWEKRLFDWAIDLSDKLHQPVPVGIAMTGLWAKAHAPELDQILAWQSAGKLAITWINHSSTHPLHCQNSSCSRARFLTAPSVNFDEEVFGLERSLLERGIVPSVIFRFPGLVHDRPRMDQLARLSLMAIDADAWIAKGQGIKPRAVVLVHGNGNEPEGITGFLRAVQTPARAANLASGRAALVSPLLIAPVPSL